MKHIDSQSVMLHLSNADWRYIPLALMLLTLVLHPLELKAQVIGAKDNSSDYVNVASEEQELTVMTFNIHAGADAPIATIANIINDANPDFVALEEIDVFTHRKNAPMQKGRNMIADLASATGMFPLYGRTLNFAGGYYGIGMLSKHPCVKSEVVELPNPDNYEPRALLEGTFFVNGKEKVIFACTHLCVEDSLTRVLQARQIADRYRNADYPVIIGGDFNSLPNEEPIRILEEVFTNISSTAPSFPSNHPELKLDYLFGRTSNSIEIISTSVLDSMSWASDHRPVVSYIKIHEE